MHFALELELGARRNQGWNSPDGVAMGYMFQRATDAPGLVALSRFLNPVTQDDALTLSMTEMQSLTAIEYMNMGTAGYVFPARSGLEVPVFRALNTSANWNAFTKFKDEYDSSTAV